MAMKPGYARVSVGEPNVDAQIQALQKAGCDEVITDEGYPLKLNRVGLRTCLEKLDPGDTLLVWRLCRIGCSVSELVTFMQTLRERSVHFHSIEDEAINTTTASGEHQSKSIDEICSALKISRATCYRYLSIAGGKRI